ncbi:MAG: sigma-70 family RNA polymerase sigma factor [Sphingomicrobium sp.]
MTDEPTSARRRAALSDALQRAGRGEKAALESIYGATSAKLFGICLRILNDRQEAEDVLQEVFVSVWQRAGSFDPARASPITWLATLARNRAIDRLRVLRRTTGSDPVDAALDIADPSPGALAALESREDAMRLAGCLGELEERTAGAIRATFFGGLTYSELAERSNVPLGTMKSWIRRGLMKLKECLRR